MLSMKRRFDIVNKHTLAALGPLYDGQPGEWLSNIHQVLTWPETMRNGIPRAVRPWSA